MNEVWWVLEYLDDLESDFSAIHRVDDIYSMSARKFFNFAERLVAYKGVVRMRAEQHHYENEKKYGGQDVSFHKDITSSPDISQYFENTQS